MADAEAMPEEGTGKKEAALLRVKILVSSVPLRKLWHCHLFGGVAFAIARAISVKVAAQPVQPKAAMPMNGG
eukprot:s308_g16.t1